MAFPEKSGTLSKLESCSLIPGVDIPVMDKFRTRKHGGALDLLTEWDCRKYSV